MPKVGVFLNNNPRAVYTGHSDDGARIRVPSVVNLQSKDAALNANKLSILIPVYNERYTVATLIDRVLAAPLPAELQRELIVVDDCSTDGSRAVLEQIAAQHGHVVKLRIHEVNRGKGAAIRTAIAEATGDMCIIQDADLEYDPTDYPALLEPILDGEADAVFGSRFAARGRRRVLYFWHAIGNRWLTTLSNLFTNLNLTDMETCYKAVRTDMLKSIPIRSDRFGIEPELTAKLAKRGCRIYEVPISYHGRQYGEGKKITWWDGVKALFVILYFSMVDDIYDERYGHAILYRLSSAHRFNDWMADQIRPWVGDDVLEIGAGLGNLSRKLMPRAHYTMSDIDPVHLDFLKNQFAGRPHTTVAKVDLQERRHFQSLGRVLDTVICLNVLEHIESDVAALDHMYETLAPGGRALVLVPRSRHLYGSLDEVLGHCRRYSQIELREKCRQVGFQVERLFTFNRISVLPWFINARIMRRKHFGKLQLKIFDHLVWLWRLIDRLLPWPGLSLIVVAKKPGDPASPKPDHARRDSNPQPAGPKPAALSN